MSKLFEMHGWETTAKVCASRHGNEVQGCLPVSSSFHDSVTKLKWHTKPVVKQSLHTPHHGLAWIFLHNPMVLGVRVHLQVRCLPGLGLWD